MSVCLTAPADGAAVTGEIDVTASMSGYFDYWDNVPHYYGFDAAGWHMISLNSTAQFGQFGTASAQYQWLATDLAANTSACTLAYFHHPVFSAGAQGDTP